MSSDGSAEWHPAVRINAFGWPVPSGGGPPDYFRVSWCVNLTRGAVRGCMRSYFHFSGPDGWRSVSVGILADGAYQVLMKARRHEQPPTRHDWQEWPLDFAGIPTVVAERGRADVEREWLDALHDLLGGAREVRQSPAESVGGRTLRRYTVSTSRWQDISRAQEAATSMAMAGGAPTRAFGDASPPRDWDGFTPFLIDLTVEQSGFPSSIRMMLAGGTWGDITFVFRTCDLPFLIEKRV
jgi:hypothetical protein